jgi:hypothetical protein
MAPRAVQATKASSRRYLDDGFARRSRRSPRIRPALAKSDDAREGVASFVERRDPKFTGTLGFTAMTETALDRSSASFAPRVTRSSRMRSSRTVAR